MEQSSTNSKLALLVALSIGLSFVQVGVLSAPFLRTIHLSYGRLKYWSLFLLGIGLLVGLKLVPAALSLSVAVVAIGVFREFEAKGKNWSTCGITSLSAALATAGIGLWMWAYSEGWQLVSKVKTTIEGFLTEAGPMLGDQTAMNEMNADMMVAQVPSLIAIMVIVALALSLVFERTVRSFFQIERKNEQKGFDLKSFRVPDLLVWASLVAFLITVVDMGSFPVTATGANVLNVMVVLYMFQGLAIIESYLRFYGVSWIWRLVSYMILIFQLFFLPIFIGFVDFWFEFRERLTKKPKPAKSTE